VESAGVGSSADAARAGALDPYRYTMWVCDVAEEIADNVKRRGSRAFAYRGVDLERAFKRSVYFRLINDDEAYGIFRSGLRGERPSLPPGEQTPTRELLAEYLSPSSAADGLRLPLREVLIDAARWAAGVMPRRLSGSLWALALQPKFVAHLRPIMEALDHPYRFITFDDQVTDEYTLSLGYLSLNAGPGRQTATLRPLSSKLDVVHGHALAYDAVMDHLSRELPRGIVLSEGNAPIYEIVNLAARRLRIPTVCIQQGWSPIVHTGFRELHFSSMVVWGDWFAEALASYNPGQRFAALGHHLIGLHAPKDLQPRTLGFFLQRGSRLISDETWTGMLDLIEFCARDLPQAQVLVREHPNGPLTDAERARLTALPAVELTPPDGATLQAVLARCDIVVSVFSTTILEGIGAGAVPLIVNVASLPSYYPDVAASGAGIEVKDFAAARNALRELWLEGTARYATRVAAMQRRLFAHGGAQALERIVLHVRREFRLRT
jgi:hypothetical protein